jgi:hypothetical protein
VADCRRDSRERASSTTAYTITTPTLLQLRGERVPLLPATVVGDGALPEYVDVPGDSLCLEMGQQKSPKSSVPRDLLSDERLTFTRLRFGLRFGSREGERLPMKGLSWLT